MVVDLLELWLQYLMTLTILHVSSRELFLSIAIEKANCVAHKLAKLA